MRLRRDRPFAPPFRPPGSRPRSTRTRSFRCESFASGPGRDLQAARLSYTRSVSAADAKLGRLLDERPPWRAICPCNVRPAGHARRRLSHPTPRSSLCNASSYVNACEPRFTTSNSKPRLWQKQTRKRAVKRTGTTPGSRHRCRVVSSSSVRPCASSRGAAIREAARAREAVRGYRLVSACRAEHGSRSELPAQRLLRRVQRLLGSYPDHR